MELVEMMVGLMAVETIVMMVILRIVQVMVIAVQRAGLVMALLIVKIKHGDVI